LPVRLRTASGASVSFDEICARHAVIADSKSAIESLKALTAKTGATNLLTWFNIGNVPHGLVQEAMQQFAAEVMPHLE
jgi:hypothetical protein